MRKLRLVLLAAALVGGPSLASAQKVDADFDPSADFAKLKTYAWKAGTPAKNPMMDKRIIEAIDGALAAEGMKNVSENPDAYVTYHGSTSEEVAIDTSSYGYGYGAGWRWGGGYGYPASSTTTVRKYTQGTLVVDIWDAGKKELVWRGKASDTMSDKADKNTKKVNKAVEKLFKKYPPEKK
jgi:hypothetical protein